MKIAKSDVSIFPTLWINQRVSTNT